MFNEWIMSSHLNYTIFFLLLLTIEFITEWSNCTPFSNLYLPKNDIDPFRGYNQYTVDQLLEKAPSVLEFAESSTFKIDEPDNDLSQQPNQNVFQLGELNHSIPSSQFSFSSSTSSSAIPYSKHSRHSYLVNTKFRSLKTINRILSAVRFNCTGYPEGYYADVDFNCRIFHYCKRESIKFTFNCPVNAIFNQKQLTCESNLRNPIKMCKSSTKYFFLNSMLYPNSNSNKNKINELTRNNLLSEQQDNRSRWLIETTTESPDSVTTETTVPPTPLLISKQLKRSKILKKSKPKWSAVEMLNSFEQIPSLSITEIPVPKDSSSTNLNQNDQISTAFSIWEPDIVSTSSASPMDQIMAPKWYQDTTSSVNDFTNIFDNNKNTNIYSLDSTSTSTDSEDSNSIGQSSTEASTSEFDSLFGHTEAWTKSKIKNKKSKPSKSTKKGEGDKFETKFNIDWDDTEMSPGEFSPIRINPRPKQPKPIFNLYSSTPLPDTEESNYLYGKPIELPENIFNGNGGNNNNNEFNPVSIESILATVPQAAPEIDIGSSIIPSYVTDQYNRYYQNQDGSPESYKMGTMLATNNNNNSNNNHNNNFFSQRMFSLFNMLGNKIGRRWAKRGIVSNNRISFPFDERLLQNRRYELTNHPNRYQFSYLHPNGQHHLSTTEQTIIINDDNNINNNNRYNQLLSWPSSLSSTFPSNNYYSSSSSSHN